jgi:hypothetical protein
MFKDDIYNGNNSAWKYTVTIREMMQWCNKCMDEQKNPPDLVQSMLGFEKQYQAPEGMDQSRWEQLL